jgi:hypothetical protein
LFWKSAVNLANGNARRSLHGHVTDHDRASLDRKT